MSPRRSLDALGVVVASAAAAAKRALVRRRALSLLATSLLGVACTGGDSKNDTGPGDSWGGHHIFCFERKLEVVEISCSDGSWAASALADCWLDDAHLLMANTAGETASTRVEARHVFPATTEFDGENGDVTAGTHDPVGYWAKPAITLEIVGSAEEVRPGEATAFSCAEQAELSFSIRALANDGEKDCVSWGHDPDNDALSSDPWDCTILDD